MKAKTLKLMLKSIPDDYDLTATPVGNPNKYEATKVTGIQVEHREYGTKGRIMFRYAASETLLTGESPIRELENSNHALLLQRSANAELKQRVAELEADAKQKTADVIMEFVNQFAEAYQAGFSPYPQCTLQQLHRVAQHHIKDNYGVKTKEFSEVFGTALFDECRTISAIWDKEAVCDADSIK